MAISGISGERAIGLPSPTEAPAPRAVRVSAPEPEAAGESPFLQALRGLGQQIDVGEKQVASASQYRDYDTATLIALQAGIYRYTEAVDLASKIVDRATNAVKTVLQGGGH
jgi:hypothetical protein